MIWVYTLSDPITNQVRYVGQSANPMTRYSQHCAAFENSTKNIWIRELKSLGLKPVLNLIEECHPELVFETESKYIIDYAKNGCDLFNIKAIDEWKPANFYLESRVKYQLKKMAFEKGMNESDFLNNMIDEAFAKFGYEQEQIEWVKKEKVIMSAKFESISLMPDGSFEPTLFNIVYGQPDKDGDVYMKGCFDKSVNKMK